ncbi:unnamed protein product [Lathyrus sativus]|nr:unnamed protein product [Lathyrus sativus]
MSSPGTPPSTEAPPPLPNFAASFTIWPPTQRTRDAVTNRLIETFSTPSILSKRYGTLSLDEASVAASQIEAESFSIADDSSSPDDDSIQILEVYSKEISKRMIETVKTRSHLADDTYATSVTASPAGHSVALLDS